jgi:hypothetical protein
MRARCLTAVGVGLALHALGCAAIVDFPDDPQLVTHAELPDDPGWGCLARPPAARTPGAAVAHVRVQACDALRGCLAPVTGLTARVCSKLDADCVSPLLADLSDVSGTFEFDVPTADAGFSGYMEVSAPLEPCTSPLFGEAGPLLCALAPHCDPQAPDASCSVPLYARALLFFNPPITADLPEPVVLSLLSSAAMPGLVRAAGSDFDPTLGNLLVGANDCAGSRAAGIRYELSDSQSPITQLYMENGVLSNATDATDATGIGAFAGVPAGFLSVAAYNRAGARVGGIGVQVAPGAISYVTLGPAN